MHSARIRHALQIFPSLHSSALTMRCYISACKTAARCHVLFKIQQQNLFAEVSPSGLSVLWWEALKHPIEGMESKTPLISAYSHCLLSVSVGHPDTETLLQGWAVEQLSSPQDMPQEPPAAQRLPGAHHFASSLQGGSSLPCAQTQQCDKHWAHHFHRSFIQPERKQISFSLHFHKRNRAGRHCGMPAKRCVLMVMSMRQRWNRWGPVLTRHSQQQESPWKVIYRRRTFIC